MSASSRCRASRSASISWGCAFSDLNRVRRRKIASGRSSLATMPAKISPHGTNSKKSTRILSSGCMCSGAARSKAGSGPTALPSGVIPQDEWTALVGISAILLWWLVAPKAFFRGEPSQWTTRQKVLAWVLFGGPFLLALFNRPFTKREVIGLAIFIAILAAGIAFEHLTCLGL